MMLCHFYLRKAALPNSWPSIAGGYRRLFFKRGRRDIIQHQSVTARRLDYGFAPNNSRPSDYGCEVRASLIENEAEK